MLDKTQQRRRTNRVFKSLHKPLAYLGVERRVFYGDSTWNRDDFRLDILAAEGLLPAHPIPARKRTSNHTHSERDWAWVLHELSRGKDAAKLTCKLASLRADKRNPLYYAQRTVDVRRPDFGSSKAFR